MLNWFVDKETAERVTRGGDLVEEYEVECRPERIPQKCLDENVCIGLIRKYFSLDAGCLLEAMYIQSTRCRLQRIGFALCVIWIYTLLKAFVVTAV